MKTHLITLLVGLATLSTSFAQNDKEVLEKQRTLVRAQEAWQKGLKGQGVIVAVIDTGVSIFHPEIMNKIAINKNEIPSDGIDNDGNGYIDDFVGWNFVSNNSLVVDDNGHGTHVAALIAGENVGIAPDAKVLPIKVLNRVGTGAISQIVKGVEYAISRGAKIINISLGGNDTASITKDEYRKIIELARQNDVLIVAAAGNNSADNDQLPFFPASIMSDNLISVCAIDNEGNISSFSNYGKLTVHLCAPGTNILSARAGGAYVYMSGTSQATPIVSGAAAILLSSDSKEKSYRIRNSIIDGAIYDLRLYPFNISSGKLSITSALNLLFKGR